MDIRTMQYNIVHTLFLDIDIYFLTLLELDQLGRDYWAWTSLLTQLSQSMQDTLRVLRLWKDLVTYSKIELHGI